MKKNIISDGGGGGGGLVGGTWFFSGIACISIISGEQRQARVWCGTLERKGWCSGENTCLPTALPRFKSGRVNAICGFERFFSRSTCFPAFLINQHFQIPISQEMVGEPCRHATSHLLNLFISCIWSRVLILAIVTERKQNKNNYLLVRTPPTRRMWPVSNSGSCWVCVNTISN